jgi:D-inositol-3-phosphate glycosyltransferase
MHPYRGGIAHFTEALYRGLEARGHEVTPLTFSRQYPERLFPGKTQYEPGAAAHLEAARMLDSINPLTWRHTARYIAQLAPDALLFKYWMPFFAPALGSIVRHLRRRGIPSIGVVHNALPHERQPGTLALTRYALNACHGLIVMSEAVEKDLRSAGVTASVRRVAHPVYDVFGQPPPTGDARAALGLPAAAPVALFFGFIRGYKGLHVLLDAMPQVVRALPDFRLVVAGEFYEDPVPYREQIRRYGLEAHVILHDRYIPGNEVGRYFAAADVIVQPYVTATQSGVAQIAYHFDKPLIVTDTGGLAEIVPHERAGLVVPPGNPEALANAVVRFFSEDLKQRLTEGVRQEKQKYSWDRVHETVEALL